MGMEAADADDDRRAHRFLSYIAPQRSEIHVLPQLLRGVETIFPCLHYSGDMTNTGTGVVNCTDSAATNLQKFLPHRLALSLDAVLAWPSGWKTRRLTPERHGVVFQTN